MKTILNLLIICFLSAQIKAQICSPDSIKLVTVRASLTDNNIPFELSQHYTWVNKTCTSKNTLLLHLVGTFDNPKNTTYFPELAANNGFHVLSLKYPNGTSAQTPCRNSSDSNCHENFRKEIIYGNDVSPDISVDSTNCITNRLIKLLQYMHLNYPMSGWDNYYTNDSVLWSKIILSGHSQGGGHAALIAKDKLVKGVIMFSSVNDYSDFFNDGALWTKKPHITPDSLYFGFGNLYDDVVDFSEQFLMWNYLGLASFGDSINVLANSCNYNNSHQLYTTSNSNTSTVNHSNVIRDNETTVDTTGHPIYTPVWKYLLGITCNTTNIHETNNSNPISLFPNPINSGEKLNIQSKREIKKIEIISLDGRIIKTISTELKHSVSIRSNDKTGIYLIKVYTNNKDYTTSKLVIN